MPENVKFTEERNSEEKVPRREHLQPIKEIIHQLHKKKFVEPSSVKAVLLYIEMDWGSGELQKWADEVERKKERLEKKFKVNEKLTTEIKSIIERVGTGVLSEDEMKEAERRFKGAKYAWSRYSIIPLIVKGGQTAGHIELLRTAPLLDEVASYGIKLHESAHFIHLFIVEKRLESGDIKDPIMKRLYEYMHGKYSNEIIDAAVRGYIGPRYQETVAEALMYCVLHKGETPDKHRDFRVADEFRLLGHDVKELGNLFKSNPETFRKLVENPSWWVEAGSVEKLVEKLKEPG